MVKTVLTVIFVILAIILAILVLMQEGKSAGLSGSIAGGSGDTYWGKNKGRSKEGKIERATKFLAFTFVLLAIVLNFKWWQ